MDNKTHRSMRTGVELLILSSLTLPVLAQAQTGPGYGGAGAYPPVQYAQSGRQVSPIPGPYGGGSGQGPGAYGMGPGQAPGGYGMGVPQAGPGMMRGPQGGRQMGGPGMMGGPEGGPGQMRGPGMMGGPEGGPAMAMLDAVARLDLTAEQRANLDAVRADLNRRQRQLLQKIAAAGAKLQEISQQQVRASRGLSDLKGHLLYANMDAANRAEEMLTDEQRQVLMSAGVHVTMPEAAR